MPSFTGKLRLVYRERKKKKRAAFGNHRTKRRMDENRKGSRSSSKDIHEKSPTSPQKSTYELLTGITVLSFPETIYLPRQVTVSNITF